MLSRARNKMGIWFEDESTKRHVKSYLGLVEFEANDTEFIASDDVNTVLCNEVQQQDIHVSVIGNSFNRSYHRAECQYAPRNPQKRVEFDSIEEATAAGFCPCRNCNP
jgi:hypothetical protein